MRNLSIIGLLAVGMVSAACAARESAPASPGGYGAAEKTASYQGQPPPAPAATSASGEAAPSAGAAADERQAAEPSKAERPGLGTTWGENRESRITTTSFTRENQSRPFDVLKLFYNDADGARAMARRAGIADFGDGIARSNHAAISVRLLDASGRSLEGFSSGANTYVVGEAGQRYTIEIRNNTGVRFEAVTTVDGLDVVNGRTGALSNRGYIVNGFSTVSIDGFRRTTDTVAAFRFGRVSDSYASQKTGEDRNVGVIGVAVFEERGASFTWNAREIDKRHAADPFPGSFAEPPPSALTF
jgi:hypothetical protein